MFMLIITIDYLDVPIYKLQTYLTNTKLFFYEYHYHTAPQFKQVQYCTYCKKARW